MPFPSFGFIFGPYFSNLDSARSNAACAYIETLDPGAAPDEMPIYEVVGEWVRIDILLHRLHMV